VIRLARVEILRLWSRRLLRGVGALVLLLVCIIVAVDAYQHSKDTTGEVATFNERRLAGYEEARIQFEQDQEAGRIPADASFPTRAEAEAEPYICFPEPSSVATFDCTPPRFPYVVTQQLPEFGRAVAVICAIAAFLLGASAAGAEWAAGTMQALLFWEPRRIRVVLAKVLGLVIVVAVLVVAAQALFTGAALLAGILRGTTAELTGDFWISHLLLVTRAVGIAGFAAVLGFSIAFGARVTAAAVGVGFIYFAVLEQLLVAWKAWLANYLVGPLLVGWLNYGFDEEFGGELRLSGQRAGVTLAVYAVAILFVATVWFRQRDVT
jgi:ABC-type transport system involved in multi-copper enzyme maturation permease subunit